MISVVFGPCYPTMPKPTLPSDPAVRNRIIRMAWEDRTTFDEIEKSLGITEAQVIRVMRQELKPSSFRLWRKRVSGRVTKHQKPFRKNQVRRPSTHDLMQSDLD